MAYRWYCTWENGASSWEDSARCIAHCKVLYSTEAKAVSAAKKHKHYGEIVDCGYFSREPYNPVRVSKVDGRRFKGWKIV
ncbi:MAG TPA: hypothetical protein VMW91_07250 [Desulfosporosinus sp.]|nr:hypothetical protein [Desulfosporosinus sp.]